MLPIDKVVFGLCGLPQPGSPRRPPLACEALAVPNGCEPLPELERGGPRDATHAQGASALSTGHAPAGARHGGVADKASRSERRLEGVATATTHPAIWRYILMQLKA